MHLYLLTEGSVILVEDDRLLLSGNAEIGPVIQQSVDLYRQLGRPPITEYRVIFQERQAVVCVGDQRFYLPQ